MKTNLSSKEASDFHYLLELMPPLHQEPAYAWLPELFCIIGHENLIKLCKVAGGEKIKIPTLTELSDSLEALDWYYKAFVSEECKITDIPPQYHQLVNRIAEKYKNVRRC